MTTWKDKLLMAIVRAKMEVVGQNDIKNEAQATVVHAMIRAYGNSPAGFIYIEPCLARSTARPPDLVLCHPDIGLLVIEVKGDPVENIQGLKAGNLILRREGYNQEQNPIRQAESVMYDIKNGVERILRGQAQPLYNVMVAFPNISEAEWIARGFHEAIPGSQMLFRDALEDLQRLKQRVARLVAETLKRSSKKKPLDAAQVIAIKQVFGDSAVINEFRPYRSWVDERKLGAYLDEIAVLEKNLSAEQQDLSRLNVDGFPRLIRGVAGSGKSVVLANLVARFINRKLHHQMELFAAAGPASKTNVAVVCFNRALVPFLAQKIRHAYKQQTLEDLPAHIVTITHFNGLLWELGQQGVIDYVPIKEDDEVQRASTYRQKLAEFAAQNPEWYDSILYDAVFVDEGQDLLPEEYEFLAALTRPHPQTNEKALVIFYDDAQNLYARPRPNWKQIGLDVQRGDRARVMKECFRNPREVVELAFNVLLGSQSTQSVQTRTFADVNYLKQLGLIEEVADHFKVRFTERTFKKPQITGFATRQEEKSWVAAEVVRLVEQEAVRPEDILILFHHSSKFLDLSDLIQGRSTTDAIKGFIKPYGPRSDDKSDYIFRDGYITISTTHSAKGYDAPIVFMVGADLFELDEKGRASFYVGATRCKLLLYITGLRQLDTLLLEAEAVNQVC